MSLYYESHVTIEPVFDTRLEQLKFLCELHGFRVADLLMQKRSEDTPERSRFDTFCSSRSVDLPVLESRMFGLVSACLAAGFKVWRYKIEDVILDSKVDDSRLRLK